MALTKTQVSQLYVTLFGRASESSGSKFWQKTQPNMTEAATNMLNDESAKAFFGNSIDTNAKFVNHIYENVFGRAAEAEGFNFWVSALEKGNARGFIVSEMIKAAEKNEPTFNKKVEISDYLADKDEAVMGTHRSVYVEALDKAVKEGVDAAKAYVDNVALDTWISTPTNPGKVETLTTRAEEKVANVFNAPMDYTPDGSDYIPTLQDEDKLIGIVGRSDNTLNATLGQQNADETTGTARTPNLVNIQNLNAKITGNVNTIDLRYADSLDKVNLHHFTNNAGDNATFNVLNISSELSGMRVANLDNSNSNVTFQFKQGILDEADNSGLLELADVNANAVRITSRSNDAEVEGYEKLNLVARSGLDVNALEVADLKELTITGSGNVEIANLTTDSNNEFNALNPTVTINPVGPITIAGGISAPNSLGFTKLDASKLDGKLTVDVSAIAREWVDPSDSAIFLNTEIIGTAKDDKIYTTVVGGRTSIDGGEGKDKLILVDGDIGRNVRNEIAAITKVESLEVRSQSVNGQTVDFDAFDNTLEQVLVRDEFADDASTIFTFNNVTKEFADNKKFVIEHSVTEDITDPDVELVINLKDVSGKADVVTVEVVNGKNTTDTFDYQITAAGVEKINLIDSDKETNTATLLTNFGQVDITGGEKDDSYTVNNVSAATVNAADYLGDLRIQAVGGDQSITLGKGNDIVTFTGAGRLTSGDKVVGGEGSDIVRGVLDANTKLNVTGVEELHIASTNSIDLDIAGGDFGKLVFVSNESITDASLPIPNQRQTDMILGGKVFNQLTKGAANAIATANIVTIAQSNITELNFSADFDHDDDNNNAGNVFAHNFNGVRLQNNATESLDVNINAALDNVFAGSSTARPDAATAYNVGHITAHGVKNFNVNITNDTSDIPAIGGLPAVNATNSSIQNITGKNIEKITLSTKGNLNVGLVTTNAMNNSITTFDASNVVGDLTANVIGLGDGAKVTMADGDNTFNALGSAGKLVNITAGNGNNTITGTAQSDFITAGDGFNTINADRGDNVISLGDGNSVVTAKEGNDTIEFGRGYDLHIDNDTTGLDATKATTTITKEDGAAMVRIDEDGAAGFEVDQIVAVGEGSELKVQWLGSTIQGASTALDGTRALNYDAATDTIGTAVGVAGTANNDLWLITDGAATNINGGAGNDVAIVATDPAAALTFNGGAGNDAAVGGTAVDTFTGGIGADVLVMQNVSWSDNNANGTFDAGEEFDNAADIVVIADGDSTAQGWDKIYKFNAAQDKLDLATNKVAGAVGMGAGATSVGAIKQHSIDANGKVTFNVAITTEKLLKDALAYLAANLDGTGDTVTFEYDANGNGAFEADTGVNTNVDSTFVFQDGTADTVVELVGTQVLAGNLAAML